MIAQKTPRVLWNRHNLTQFESCDFQAITFVLDTWLASPKGDLVMRSIAGAFFCLALLSGSAWAATLEPGQGDLSINQGSGFQPVNARVDAKIGDSVVVTSGGSATLVYDDGCQVQVQPGAVVTVAPLSPCAASSYAQGGPNTDANTGTALGALAVVGGITAGIVYEGTQNNNNSSPSSP